MKIAIVLYGSLGNELDKKIFNTSDDGIEDVQDYVVQAVEKWSVNVGDTITIEEVTE